MKTSLVLIKIHKWVGLIIGIQIVLWFLSGLVMSWFNINTVRGDHLLTSNDEIIFTNFTQALKKFPTNGATILSAESIILISQPYLLIKTNQGTSLFNPRSLSVVSPLSKAFIKNIVASRLAKNSAIISAELIYDLPSEVRGRSSPLWKVLLDDTDNSRLYLSPISGQIKAKRTNTWRVFDFFWMLHIMDYDKRFDFNHPLLIISAFFALLVSLSGVWLLIYRFNKTR